MEKNRLLLIASIIFGIVGFLHLLRSIFSWELTVDNFNIPLYFSYAVVIVLGYLSWSMYNMSKK
jgi:hypothetical protein